MLSECSRTSSSSLLICDRFLTSSACSSLFLTSYWDNSSFVFWTSTMVFTWELPWSTFDDTSSWRAVSFSLRFYSDFSTSCFSFKRFSISVVNFWIDFYKWSFSTLFCSSSSFFSLVKVVRRSLSYWLAVSSSFIWSLSDLIYFLLISW